MLLSFSCDMNKDNCCPVERRTILASVGTTAALGAGGTAGATRSEEGEVDDHTGREPVVFADLDVRTLGTDKPSAAVPYLVQRLPKHERQATKQAIKSEIAELFGTPSFGLYATMTNGKNYFEAHSKWVGFTDQLTTTLKAKPLEHEPRENGSIIDSSTLDDLAHEAVTEAIAKARYLHNRRSNEVDPLAKMGTSEAFLQRYSVIDPHLTVSATLLEHENPFVVHDQDALYRIEVDEQKAPVETFELRASEVASSSTEFDDWFIDEHVAIDHNYRSLTAEEQQLISDAESDLYQEQSPFSERLSMLFERLDISERGNGSEYRYALLNGELKHMTVEKAIGC